MKKITLILVAALLVAVCSSCGSTPADNSTATDTYTKITLSQEDTDLLASLKDDIIVITDENYIATFHSFAQNLSEHEGKIYQVEGEFSYRQIHNESLPYLYRIQKSADGTETEVGILLDKMLVFPDEGDWVKITGVISTEEHEGHSHIILSVISVETPQKHGTLTLSDAK